MKSTIVFALATLAVCVTVIAGCNSRPDTPQTASPKTGNSAKLPIFKNGRGEIICPVSGNVIKSTTDAAGYQDFRGKRYYFCCGMCPPKFRADPEKYAVRHETEPM